MSTQWELRLSHEQRAFFRTSLRNARAAALSDAEGFQGILFAIERLGFYLTRPPTYGTTESRAIRGGDLPIGQRLSNGEPCSSNAAGLPQELRGAFRAGARV